MPHLFCEEHGREHEETYEAEQEDYRFLGETVLVVTGPLKSPSDRCDRCRTRLRRGQRGYVVTAFPRCSPEGLDRYDYAQGREYFLPGQMTSRRYGAVPPGGPPVIPSPIVVIEESSCSG